MRKKNWTWIYNEGYIRHSTERAAIAYMRVMLPGYGHRGYDKLTTTDLGINPEAGFFSDEEIADILNQ